jgi:hypothetical protein
MYYGEKHHMALIHCPECNNQISDQAPSCPQCGYLLQTTAPVAPVATPIVSNASLRVIVIFIVIGIMFGLFYRFKADFVYFAEIKSILQDMEATFAETEKIDPIIDEAWMSVDYNDGSISLVAEISKRLDKDTQLKILEVNRAEFLIKLRVKELVVPEQYAEFHERFLFLHKAFSYYVQTVTDYTVYKIENMGTRPNYITHKQLIVYSHEIFIEQLPIVKQEIPW